MHDDFTDQEVGIMYYARAYPTASLVQLPIPLENLVVQPVVDNRQHQSDGIEATGSCQQGDYEIRLPSRYGSQVCYFCCHCCDVMVHDIPVLQICNARMTRPFFLYERGGTPTTLDLSNVAIWLLTNLFVLKHCCLNFQNVLVPFQISGVGGRAQCS